MKPLGVKQEGKSPKREQTHEARQDPHRAETYKPGPFTLSHVALEKRKGSQAPSIPVGPTGQDERSRYREIAETPEIAMSRRPAETPGMNIGQRLPVRTTKVVPSIEVAESSTASSSEREESSASEYDDEQWRRHLAQRGPVRKPITKGLVSKPNARVPAAGSTITLPAAKAAKTVQASTRPVPQSSRDTATVEGPNHTAKSRITTFATTGAALRTAATTVTASKTTTAPTAPQTTASQSPQLAPGGQPRKRPVKLKDNPDAWWAKRAGKAKLSKTDQKELDDYNRRQRHGTANFHRPTKEQFEQVFRPYREKNAQLRSTASGSVSSAQPRSSSDVNEESHYVISNSGEPPTEDVSICRSIERDQTPNLVDQLTEKVSHVIGLGDIAPEHTTPVKSEISEVPEPVASAAEHQILPDGSMFELVSKEVAALRCELQFFKGQVSAYEKTLEVDGVQLQHRLAFDAGVKKKQNPQDPENHQELGSDTNTSAPSDLGRQKLEQQGEAGQTEVPRGDPILSSRTEETESRRSEPGEPSLTGRDSGKRARTFTGEGPPALEEDDHGVDIITTGRPSKRSKKGKLFKQENEGPTQGGIVAPLRAPEPELSETSQAAADQPRPFDPEEEKDRQLIKRIQTRLSTATSASRPADTHAKSSPAHDGSTSAQQVKNVLAAPQRTTTASGAQPIGRDPEATRSVGPVAINNHLPSTDATRIKSPHGAQEALVASISASGANKATRGGKSGSGPSVWTAGVNSIPLGPRQQRREPLRGQTTHDRWNRPWQRPYDRREVFLPDSLPRCICSLLHPYFESGLNRRPSLEAFPGTRVEFFANVEQIVNCRGHDKEMIIFCEGLWASEKINRKTISQTYRFPTGMNVHLRFPDHDTIPSADGSSFPRHVTLPPEYGTHLKDECLDRERRVRRNRPSPIPPHLFYGTAAPGANGPGKRKQPPR